MAQVITIQLITPKFHFLYLNYDLIMKYFKFLLIFKILLLVFNSKAQNSQEIGFISDNDLYASTGLDRYYTNGLELFYRKARKTYFANYYKNIYEFKLGQKIYNPYSRNLRYIITQDRPYAGYLYFNYLNKFINNNNIFLFGIEAGYTGKKTYAKETQNLMHKICNFEKSDGWKTQVKQKLSLGIYLGYIYSLYHNSEKKFQIAFINDFTLNSIFTNISSGIALKYNISKSKTTSIANTSFFNTSLQIDKEKWSSESFFGIKSYVKYQIEDITVTGKLHNNITKRKFHIQPWVWYLNIGYYHNFKRFTVSFHHILHTKNTRELIKKWVRYGSIQFSYKF